MTLPELSQVSFWLFAAMMVFGALGVVMSRSIVYSALFLLITFLSIAGVFVMLNAPFIAAAQILVYGVGLTIVMIFGIMLTGDQPFVDPVGHSRPKRYVFIPAVVALVATGYLIWALLRPDFATMTTGSLFSPKAPDTMMAIQAINEDGGIKLIAQLIFGKYMLPFELASILLLLATIGAVILAKKNLPEEEGQLPLGRIPLEMENEEVVEDRFLVGGGTH